MSSGELIFGPSKAFIGLLHIAFLASQREKDLADVDSGCLTLRLTKGSSHTGLESIGSSARKHFIDTQHVPRVATYAEMEGVFSAPFDHVFVACNTGCFEGFHADLFFFS